MSGKSHKSLVNRVVTPSASQITPARFHLYAPDAICSAPLLTAIDHAK
jgi:hypothetical protein